MKLVLSALLALMAVPRLAGASEYPLRAVSFLSAREVGALRQVPARTTHEAGRLLATDAQRRNASRRIGVKPARLGELASLFDLLRVRGVGPKMAVLLRASGVESCEALGEEKAGVLVQRLRETNARLRVAQKLPDAGILADWIKQARSLPPQYRAATKRR